MFNYINNFMKKILIALCTLLMMACAGVHQDELTLTWQYAPDDEEKRTYILTIKNSGSQDINLTTHELWFNSMYQIKEVEQPAYSIHDENGNLYRIAFTEDLSKGDSLIVQYETNYSGVTHTSITPNGFYLQHKEDPQTVIALKNPHITLPHISDEDNKEILASLFDKNASFTSDQKQLILPTPAQIQVDGGELTLSGEVGFFLDNAFSERVRAHFEKLATSFPSIHFNDADNDNATVIVEQVDGLDESEYTLVINEQGIRIQASHAEGAFYALQSLKSLLPADYLTAKADNINLPHLTVHDTPRYVYRGLMLDISRNFRDLKVLKKYIDAMAQYKLNTLHLHFSDDEGWRLEIPSLPELTEIGANRSPYFADGKSLQPSYGSGTTVLEKQYLTVAEFKELLQYADERFITVIPEIETPGHGRAAVKAMEQRYHRLLANGQQEEAERFLMNDLDDKSNYFSAQFWTDNVMNPAMPGTYNFIGHVLDEIKAMYTDAGLTLEKISIGGDEVPTGVWDDSPKIRALMETEGMNSQHEVWPYYVDKVHQIYKEKGLTMAGWEEIGMVNKGQGMVVNEELSDRGFVLDVWNNMIGGGQEDLAYRLANAGYKVVFISATNYYFDMVWNNDFREPGLTWASKTDLYHAYSLLPESFFANILHTERGAPLGKAYFDNKIRLTEEGKKNIVGLKGALWSETVLDDERVDYMIFPRFFALAERAWAPKRPWESESRFDKQEFDQTYAAFREKIGTQELMKLGNLAGGFSYRLPSVGLKEVNGKLHANTEYPGFTIRYTRDGSDPSASSAVFPAEGLLLEKAQTIKAVATHEERVGKIVSEYNVY